MFSKYCAALVALISIAASAQPASFVQISDNLYVGDVAASEHRAIEAAHEFEPMLASFRLASKRVEGYEVDKAMLYVNCASFKIGTQVPKVYWEQSGGVQWSGSFRVGYGMFAKDWTLIRIQSYVCSQAFTPEQVNAAAGRVASAKHDTKVAAEIKADVQHAVPGAEYKETAVSNVSEGHKVLGAIRFMYFHRVHGLLNSRAVTWIEVDCVSPATTWKGITPDANGEYRFDRKDIAAASKKACSLAYPQYKF